MNWLRNNFKEILLYIFVFVLVCCVCKAYADESMCANGFEGELVADTPQGQTVVTDAILRFSDYNDTQLFLYVGPPHHEYVIPLAAIVFIKFTIQACTYRVEYDDDVFGNGFQ